MSGFVLRHARLARTHPERVAIAWVDDATVVVRDGKVVAVGAGGLPGVDVSGLRELDARGALVTPGLVDAHTHAWFLGDRATEFCARAAGASYLELAKLGGGIAATVRATRTGSAEQRRERARLRLRRLAGQGVTTVEAKSGYGLSVELELAALEELSALRDPELPRLSTTLLAAHAIPPECTTPESRRDWLTRVTDELTPEVAGRGLAERVDIFVEQSAYTADEARQVAASARRSGLGLHMHVDQLTAGRGAELAAELGAQAVAHLERVGDEGIAALAKAGVVAVLLPTATLAAREPAYAPARRLLEAGVRPALATNLNPGTAPTESTALMFFLAAVGLQLTPEESLWAATRGGALALGLPQAGLVEPGCPADLVLWNCADAAHLAYHAAINHVRLVWREGRLIVDRTESAEADCDGML